MRFTTETTVNISDLHALMQRQIKPVVFPILVAMLLGVLGLTGFVVLEAFWLGLRYVEGYWWARLGMQSALIVVMAVAWWQREKTQVVLFATSVFISVFALGLGAMALTGASMMMLLPAFVLLMVMAAPLLLSKNHLLIVIIFCISTPLAVLMVLDVGMQEHMSYMVYLVVGLGMAFALRWIRFRSITYAHAYQKFLEQENRTDKLTGVRNREGFMQEGAVLMAQVQASEQTLALIFIDLDHFKAVNDTYGHRYGDGVLKNVGKQIASCVRTHDVVARVGGDEFVVLVPGISENALQALAERMRMQVNSHPDLKSLSISVGMAFWDGHESMEELRHRADLAMLDAKRSGRNRVFSA